MMTTPERLRRRQLIEGTIVLLLAIFTVLQALYFTQQDREQRDCLAQTVQEIANVQKIRARLNERESEATKKVIGVYAEAAQLLRDDPNEPLPPKAQEKLTRDLVAALLNYGAEAEAVRRARADNPVPEYPKGRCD